MPTITRLQHAAITVPIEGLDEARHFYSDLLGLKEVPRPPELQSRAGIWYSLEAQSCISRRVETWLPRKAIGIPRSSLTTSRAGAAASLSTASRSPTADDFTGAGASMCATHSAICSS